MKKMKRILATLGVAAAPVGLVLGVAGPAAAAGTNMSVTKYSQTAIWSQDVKGQQYSVPIGGVGFSITAVWTGADYCTAIRYPDNTIVYGYSNTWVGLSSIHGAPRLESWKGCWN